MNPTNPYGSPTQAGNQMSGAPVNGTPAPKSNALPIVVTICVTLLILGAGYFYFINKNSAPIDDMSQPMVLSSTYDGTYSVAAMPTDARECASAQATAVVTNGVMTGTLVTATGINAGLSAMVDGSGNITPGGTTNGASFNGMMSATGGAGTWSDVYGCTGTFTMVKQGPASPAPAANVQTVVTSNPAPAATNKVTVTTNTASKPAAQPTNTVTSKTTVGGTTITTSYSGNWNGRAINTTAGLCQNYTITGTVSNGYLTGVAKGERLGDTSKFGALVSASGAITPGQGGQLVRFTGQMNGTTATGNWAFTEDSGVNCGGTFTFTKTN